MKQTMKTKVIACLVSLLTSITVAPAAVLVAVDMDTVTPGIQSTIIVAPGAIFSVNLLVTSDLAGVSSYGISALFDNTELTLNGVPDSAAATEFLPAGFAFNINAGVNSASQALGQVYTFDAATFGAGPVATMFAIGSISFVASAPVTNASLDVTPGLFNVGFDGIFDNAGGDLGPGAVFVGGTVNVVPEPASAALLLAGAGVVALRNRRRLR